ncbi:TPA: hypothetical protein ACTY0Q_001945 [Klebsiella pneumoniae]
MGEPELKIYISNLESEAREVAHFQNILMYKVRKLIKAVKGAGASAEVIEIISDIEEFAISPPEIIAKHPTPEAE